MKLRQFLNTCNTNTVDIEVYASNDELLYEGTLYLIYHNHEDNNGKTLTETQRQQLLDSNVEAWELTNYESIAIYCDYR